LHLITYAKLADSLDAHEAIAPASQLSNFYTTYSTPARGLLAGVNFTLVA
jgi:hypothetical protein